MLNLVYALAIAFGGYWLLRQFVATPASQAAKFMRNVGGMALIGVAGLLAMRGSINVAIPIFVFGLGLMGQSGLFGGAFPWGQKSSGQRSRVATSLLAMELDHDSGRMDGQILAGPLKGRLLSALKEDELKAFHRQCTTVNDQSRALLEAWLDRSKAGWRETWQAGPRGNGGTPSATMSRAEALAVLGLKEGASEEDIRAAHRRLMKEFHPDRGGSDYLAAKINQAKDILL
ncbi:DnaJ domain-containing protein [Aestuariivirga sp. YIM B02566]|uniref:DnaJ domain-containing protein n=1 Tax=Taklimakanibacter albus TaxID=2800327 RepID=UPI001FEFA1FA|nr:DnaJ domain-containing protein [Aestuariivirga sp. YIM B02566]